MLDGPSLLFKKNEETRTTFKGTYSLIDNITEHILKKKWIFEERDRPQFKSLKNIVVGTNKKLNMELELHGETLLRTEIIEVMMFLRTRSLLAWNQSEQFKVYNYVHNFYGFQEAIWFIIIKKLPTLISEGLELFRITFLARSCNSYFQGRFLTN